jgi:pimeloyl-ACP methyl ester carboxylesterase
MNVSRQTLLRLADGRNLDVRVSGPPDGRVLLLHNGTPAGPTRDMEAAAHRLGLRFVTAWRPGYGESSRQPGRCVVDVVADTEAVLNFIGVGRCLVAGWSGGGPRALACGARLSERVGALAVIASLAPYPAEGLDWAAGMTQDNIEGLAVALQGEAADRSLAEAARAQVLQATPAEMAAGMSSSLSAADLAVSTEEVMEDLAANYLEALRLGADGWIDDDLAGVKPWGFNVAEVAVPTILWHGTEDRMVPVAHGEWLAERIPGVVAHIEQGEGHGSIALVNMDRILRDLVDASRGRL